MADKLIFPIGFDLEAAVKQAQKDGDKVVKNLQQIFSRQPLVLKTDTRGFAELMQDTDTLKARLKEVAAQFNQMPTAVKFNLDSEGRVKQLSADGKALWDELMRINTALQGVSMSATQLLRQNQREMEAEQKAEKKRQEAIAASLRTEYKRIEAKKQAEAASRRELEMLNRQYAAEERRQRLAASQASIAKRQQVLNTLRAEENTIVNITAKLQHWQKVMNSSDMNGKQFKRATEEVQRLSQKLSEAQAKISQLTGATTTAVAKQSAAVRQVTNEFKNQDGYISRLLKRMAVYAGYSAIGSFLTNVREVTAEFELQRVSLGAIIQDQARANALFSEIKTFALKSPVSILDLTKYTKQLAAYKIGVDELFETTKKLTDVSVGLGVSMDRVVLAYGQIRARGALYSTEVKQLTEMGIPIVESLAEKLSKANGELVTASEVMDLIEKRAISFELVKEVFDDMTSAGGMFYNMQEKQGNTLYGMWAKLGDAASLMYEQIGNTGAVNSAMKNTIGLLTELMRNWETVAKTAAFVIAPTALTGLIGKKGQTAIDMRLPKAIEARRIAQERLNAATEVGSAKDVKAAQAALSKAAADEKAAMAEKQRYDAMSRGGKMMQQFKTGIVSLGKSLLTGLGVGAVIAGITTLSYKLFEAYEKANRLKNKLNEIDAERIIESDQSVRNFEYLAEAALKAASGSKEQKEAIEELQRTYKDMIPEEDLTIKNLRELRAGAENASEAYKTLTDSIRHYINERMKQKAMDAVTEEFTPEINSAIAGLRGWFKENKFSDEEYRRFISELRTVTENGITDITEQIKQAGANAGLSFTDEMVKSLSGEKSTWQSVKNVFTTYYTKGLGRSVIGLSDQLLGTDIQGFVKATGYIEQFAEATSKQAAAMQDVNAMYSEANEGLKNYGHVLDKVNNSLNEMSYMTLQEGKFSLVPEDSFLKSQMQTNAFVQEVAKTIREDNSIKEAFDKLGVTIKDEWFDIVTTINEAELGKLSSIQFDEILDAIGSKDPELKKLIKIWADRYKDLIPSDPVAKQIRARFFEITSSTGASIDTMQHYLWDGKTALDEHIKTLDEQITKYEAEIYRMNAAIAKGGVLGMLAQAKFGDKVKDVTKTVEALRELMKFEKSYVKDETSKSGRTSDPRLNNLKEEISLVQKLYNEYKQLEKQEGASKAAADMEKMAGVSIKSLSDKYGIKLPTTAKDVAAALEILYKKMAQLPKKVFPSLDKDLQKLRWTIEKVNIDDAQQKIEAELKKLSDRISRTKTAKEFYEKILSQTGDMDLAASLTMNIYGTPGQDLNNQIRQYIEEIIGGTSAEIDLDIFRTDGSFDPKKLRAFAEANKELLGKNGEAYKELIKLADNAEKDFTKMLDNWMKAVDKSKTYSSKLLDLYRTTQTEIDRISLASGHAQVELAKLMDLPDPTDEQKQQMDRLTLMIGNYVDLIDGFRRKQAEGAAKLQYEAFKDSPMYVQLFDDLDNASTRMLENMKERMETLKGEWQNLDPTQLKELQSRLNEIDNQLAKRNPFSTLAKTIKKYRDYMKNGEADGGTKSAKEADTLLINSSEAAQKAADKYKSLLDKYSEGNKKTAEELAEEHKDLAQAKKDLDDAMSNEKAAQKAVENWMKVEKAIKLSANELFSMLNWAGDIARAVADISEAMGADEEDVQYWNDIADALGQVAGGIQDIVSAAKSGNVVGIVSSVLTAIPKMFVGFSNLFAAGKIRKANKEIKRQQELLDSLEYTYSRLQKAADKLFGTDYISNYNQQLKVLNAQAQAYQKQYQAESSKGKNVDKDKLKEYQQAYRDTMDEIADMQGQLIEKFTGTGKTDVAKQMAQSWLEARASLSDTYAAIYSDYSDMIKNMIVEGAAARVIENALTPMWDKVDKMLANNNIDGAIDALVGGMDDALNAANNGMEVLWKALESKGYDLKKLIGDVDNNYTGIKREVSSATSEEINANTAALNVQNHYMSFMPNIDTNVAFIRQYLERGSSVTTTSARPTGWTDWQQQAMDQYMAIQRNTADTVVECRRAAQAAEKSVAVLSQVIKTKGSPAQHSLHVTID